MASERKHYRQPCEDSLRKEMRIVQDAKSKLENVRARIVDRAYMQDKELCLEMMDRAMDDLDELQWKLQWS